MCAEGINFDKGVFVIVVAVSDKLLAIPFLMSGFSLLTFYHTLIHSCVCGTI